MSVFSQNSTFTKFMSRLTDVCCLNILWIVFSLPVVTTGAATVAAYSVALKMVDDEESYIVKPFVQAFKRNFIQGTILWLLTAAALYALYLELQLAVKPDKPSVVVCIAGILSVTAVFCTFVYAYPLTARYQNTLANTMRNSLQICAVHPFKTLAILVVCTATVFLFTFNTLMEVFGVLVGPMILVYTVSGVSKRIFRKIEADGGTRPPQSGTDHQSDGK